MLASHHPRPGATLPQLPWRAISLGTAGVLFVALVFGHYGSRFRAVRKSRLLLFVYADRIAGRAALLPHVPQTGVCAMSSSGWFVALTGLSQRSRWPTC